MEHTLTFEFRLGTLALSEANDESLATFRDYPTAGIFDLRLFRLPKETPSVELLLDRLPTKDLIFVYR